jgi:hypothetical protein
MSSINSDLIDPMVIVIERDWMADAGMLTRNSCIPSVATTMSARQQYRGK